MKKKIAQNNKNKNKISTKWGELNKTTMEKHKETKEIMNKININEPNKQQNEWKWAK